jgi:hypothetical protein
MFFSGSMSATSTCSSILWMVAFTGPNSTTWGQMREMKRPSLVPPVVDSSVCTPVSAWMACRTASTRAPGVVRNGRPLRFHSSPWSRPWRVTTSDTAACSLSGVHSVEKRKLKSMTTVPGTTLVAPVPPWMLLTWKLVGGK